MVPLITAVYRYYQSKTPTTSISFRLRTNGTAVAIVSDVELLESPQIITLTLGLDRVAVFFDNTYNASLIYNATLTDGTTLTFRSVPWYEFGGPLVFGMSAYVDFESESAWNFRGECFQGPLVGRRLQPVTNSWKSYWFVASSFNPDYVVLGANLHGNDTDPFVGQATREPYRNTEQNEYFAFPSSKADDHSQALSSVVISLTLTLLTCGLLVWVCVVAIRTKRRYVSR